MTLVAPTSAAYDSHFRDLAQAIAIWQRTLANEKDPKMRALIRRVLKHQTAYMAALRELLAHYRAQRGEPKALMIDVRTDN